jgi:hypothetical protein
LPEKCFDTTKTGPVSGDKFAVNPHNCTLSVKRQLKSIKPVDEAVDQDGDLKGER